MRVRGKEANWPNPQPTCLEEGGFIQSDDAESPAREDNMRD